MLRLRNVLLTSVLGIAASAPVLFAIPEQEPAATVEQVLELAQTIDGASAAKLWIGYMHEELVRAKDYVAKCDYSSVLKAQKDGADCDVVDEQLGKVCEPAFDLLLGMQPDRDFRWLKRVACGIALEKDEALDHDEAADIKFSCPKTEDPQVLIDAINDYFEQFVKGFEGFLAKNFDFSQANTQAAEATMSKIIELAKKVDGVHAAEYYLTVMDKVFAEIKERAARYDYSNICKARSLLDVGCERELLKNEIFEGAIDSLADELGFSMLFCQSTFDFDTTFCKSVADAINESCDSVIAKLSSPIGFDPQVFAALVSTCCDNAAAAARVLLVKRFNLHVPHCVVLHGMV